MKQKIFEVGKKAYTFNQARYEEDMGRCVITAVSERYITDDIGNKFTVSSDDRDYLTAEGNRTLRLYVSEKEALEDMKIAKKEHVYPLVPFLTVGYIITLIILIIQGQHISWLL